jgi:hypothetical protein
MATLISLPDDVHAVVISMFPLIDTLKVLPLVCRAMRGIVYNQQSPAATWVHLLLSPLAFIPNFVSIQTLISSASELMCNNPQAADVLVYLWNHDADCRRFIASIASQWVRDRVRSIAKINRQQLKQSIASHYPCIRATGVSCCSPDVILFGDPEQSVRALLNREYLVDDVGVDAELVHDHQSKADSLDGKLRIEVLGFLHQSCLSLLLRWIKHNTSNPVLVRVLNLMSTSKYLQTVNPCSYQNINNIRDYRLGFADFYQLGIPLFPIIRNVLPASLKCLPICMHGLQGHASRFASQINDFTTSWCASYTNLMPDCAVYRATPERSSDNTKPNAFEAGSVVKLVANQQASQQDRRFMFNVLTMYIDNYNLQPPSLSKKRRTVDCELKWSTPSRVSQRRKIEQ